MKKILSNITIKSKNHYYDCSFCSYNIFLSANIANASTKINQNAGDTSKLVDEALLVKKD